MNIIKYTVPGTFRSGGTIRECCTLIRNMLYSYGWLRTIKQKKSLNSANKAIPWFTYPAIDFLSQFDYKDKDVFEYGAGFSTLFWSERAKSVTSIESDKEWYEKIKPGIGNNVTLILSEMERSEYAGHIERYALFDIIVIDGTGESRLTCAQIAKRHLREGGMIILDNADLWVKSAEYLRADTDLIQVDFTGFGPFVSNAFTTSIFLSRTTNLKPHSGHQPHKSVAQPSSPWEEAS